MKLTLNNGKALDVVSVEESYYPRNTQGVILSIHMNSGEDLETLKDIFTPEALEAVTVGEGESAKMISGYTQIDSLRKLYSGSSEYDTVVDLVKKA